MEEIDYEVDDMGRRPVGGNPSPPSPRHAPYNTYNTESYDRSNCRVHGIQNGTLDGNSDLNHRSNSMEPGLSDDDSLLGSEVNNETLNSMEIQTMTRVHQRNLITSMVVMSFSIMSYSIFITSFSQWIYIRFQQEVMGANFSRMNASVKNDPCHKGDNHTSPFVKQLNEAQSKSSIFNIWTMLVLLGPALLTNIIIGAFADRIGRRFLFILPMAGFTLRVACTCVVSYWELSVYYLFIGMGVAGCSGGLPALFMGLYVYTADNTTPNKSRSFGMTVAQTVISLMFSLSNLGVGYFIDACGYTWPMVLALGMSIVALVLCIIFLRETLERREAWSLNQLTQGVKDVFSFYLIKSKNPKYRRKDYGLLGIVFFLFGTCIGVSIITLYEMNEPFCWNAKKIGIVSTLKGILMSLVSLGAMRLLQKLMSDEVICVLSLFSTAADYIVQAFAVNDWMMYLAFTVGMLELLVLPIIRAILSRMVPLEKRGSIFASIAVIEVVTIVAAGAGFDGLYAETVGYWHGLTYFVIGCCVLFAAFLMILYIFILWRREASVRCFNVPEPGAGVLDGTINPSINNGQTESDWDDADDGDCQPLLA